MSAPVRPLDYHLEPANDRLAEAIRESAGRMVGLGRIDPTDGDRSIAEARRCIENLAFAGMFLHPLEEAVPITRAGAVLKLAGVYGVPVVVAPGYVALSEPLQIAQLASEFPEVPIVMTPGGQINISGLSMADAWLALSSHGNLHVMTNGEYRQDFIERRARDLDHTRVLYASFAPAFEPRFELKRIRSARMSDEARAAIESANATRLFRVN